MKNALSLRAAALAPLLGLALGCSSGKPAPALPMRLTGFHAPESVLCDAARDVYWISNMGGGGPLAHDGDGFVSRVTPGGAVDVRFVSRERSGATLDAPKGMAVVGRELYVADIDKVRVFDADTGAPSRELAVAGADMLNDVAAGPDGTLYVSELAVDADFKPTGRDAIYRLPPGGALERWIASPQLGNPNGIAVTEDAIWVVTYGTGELLEIAPSGAIRARHTAPEGALDGIEAIGEGRFLVTSWAARAVFVATRAGVFTVERSGVESPADLGFDSARRRVLLPLMNSGEVLIDTPRAE